MSLNGLYNALGYPLAFFYYLIPNLGVAIILLTCAVMLILYPLTAKQARSMIAMQRLQPEIKKLQAKYKGDRQKLNEEVMKVYQENKVNPLAGCLPLLVQMPIFFGLFRTLKNPYQHVPKTGTFTALYHAMCGASVSCHAGHPTPQHFLGIDLFKTPTDSSLGFPGALPYYLLVAVVVLTGILQTRQAQSRTPAANKQMGTVMKVLPVFFGLITLEFPAGLGLYFAVSNLWRVGQQEIIFRRIGTATSPGAKTRQLDEAQKPKAIDVASRERDFDDGDDRPPAPEPARAGPKPKPKPRPKPAPRAAERRPAAKGANAPAKSGRAARAAAARPGPAGVQEAGGGGLRGFFKLPPPPDANGGGRAPGTTRPPSNGGPSRSGGGAGGSGPDPRPRSAKKKRKR